MVNETHIPILEGEFSLQVELVMNDLSTATQLLRKNFQKILDNVQQKAANTEAELSKELEKTKEELEILRIEHDDTKSKLAKIRSALGF